MMSLKGVGSFGLLVLALGKGLGGMVIIGFGFDVARLEHAFGVEG